MRAFTLLEMMFALGLAAVVAAAATTTTVSVYRSIVDMEHRTYAQEEAKSIIDALATQALQIGGGDVRPWQAVSNGCFIDSAGVAKTSTGATCTGTGGKRVDFLDLNDGGVQCRLTAVSTNEATGANCCISKANGFDDAKPVNIVLLPAYPSGGPQAGGGWRTFRCTPDTTKCACKLTALTDSTDLAAINTGFAFPTNYVGGLLAVGDAVSWTFDATKHELREARDANNDGTVEHRLISDRVFDFNVAWAYDGQPEDGLIDSTATGPTWSRPLETRTATSALLVNDPSWLRMVRIGVLTGASVGASSTAPSSASLLGNATVNAPGFYLQQAQTAVTLRNMLVFF